MATLAVEHHPLANSVNIDADSLVVGLIDGRTISVPLAWFPSLSSASPSQLKEEDNKALNSLPAVARTVTQRRSAIVPLGHCPLALS